MLNATTSNGTSIACKTKKLIPAQRPKAGSIKRSANRMKGDDMGIHVTISASRGEKRCQLKRGVMRTVAYTGSCSKLRRLLTR